MMNNPKTPFGIAPDQTSTALTAAPAPGVGLSGDPDRLAYPVNEAARLIGISRESLYRLVKSGAINPVKLGHRTLFRRIDLEALLAANLQI